MKTEMDSVLRETEVLEAELDVLLNKVDNSGPGGASCIHN